MYQFSTDYEELFKLICDGQTVAGFVDYRFDRGNPDEVPMRDVVQIRRDNEFSILIGARGIAYGSIYPFQSRYGSEREVFIGTCQAINLAFIPAQTRV